MKLFDRSLVLETFRTASPKPPLDEMKSLYETINSNIDKDSSITHLDLPIVKMEAEKVFNTLKEIKQAYEEKKYKTVVELAIRVKRKLKKENTLFKLLERTPFIEYLNNYKNKSSDALMSLAEAIYHQGGILLIYGPTLEDGTRRLYVTTAKQFNQYNRVKMDASAGIPNRNMTISDDVYRLALEDGNLKAKGIAWSSPDGKRKALGMNGNNVGLHHNKTPLHQETLQYNNIGKMLYALKGSIIHLPNVRWQN